LARRQRRHKEAIAEVQAAINTLVSTYSGLKPVQLCPSCAKSLEPGLAATTRHITKCEGELSRRILSSVELFAKRCVEHCINKSGIIMYRVADSLPKGHVPGAALRSAAEKRHPFIGDNHAPPSGYAKVIAAKAGGRLNKTATDHLERIHLELGNFNVGALHSGLRKALDEEHKLHLCLTITQVLVRLGWHVCCWVLTSKGTCRDGRIATRRSFLRVVLREELLPQLLGTVLW
jgi:hypothetical protein